ncbi:hypothetical protein CY0110_31645 [Crocosphaera chwakensis CCY0110]|uniref:YspA cpYpsA-related SLOG domain-containing protein n=2 Tax=Crocosphaera TaxID=263510 RepID=A3IWG5_9CHRO|nr:hypothetical protein CY0110_31645 [Crocosphaera chwakensis CCY0110]
MLKVVIAASDGFGDYYLLERSLDKILQNYTDIELVSLHSKSLNRIIDLYARKREILTRRFVPNLLNHGENAKNIVIEEVIEYASHAILFVDENEELDTVLAKIRDSGLHWRAIKYKDVLADKLYNQKA